VELGAEFIHGRPPETWKLLESHGVPIREVDGSTWCVETGQTAPCDFFSEIDKILRQMDRRKADESFLDFLRYRLPRAKNPQERRAREWATRYVTGFNAADPSLVGVHWLVDGMRAEEKIEGERAFRAEHGYTDLIEIFQRQLADRGISVRTRSVVERIDWRPGHVGLIARCPEETLKFSARRLLITVPLGVLQAGPDERGAIRFLPDLPQDKIDAIRGVMMGKVTRVTLRFSRRFWEDLPRGSETRFYPAKSGNAGMRIRKIKSWKG
jgi:monoamine oxidase